MKNNQYPPEILITGGTGLLGRSVCKLFDFNQIPYVVATHRKGSLNNKQVYINLANGDGIKAAVAGKKIILHLASDKKHPDNDVKGTKLLLTALQQLNTTVHFIYISIVGVDLLNMPYFKQKWQVEQEIIKSGIPFSILRATQFHEYLNQVLSSLLKFPIGLLPKEVPIQPTSIAPVATALFQLTQQKPINNTISLGGKEVMTLKSAADSWLKNRTKKKWVLYLPVWGSWGKNLLSGALVCDQKSVDGQTWEEWLKTSAR